jgi:hypothetical protein
MFAEIIPVAALGIQRHFNTMQPKTSPAVVTRSPLRAYVSAREVQPVFLRPEAVARYLIVSAGGRRPDR